MFYFLFILISMIIISVVNIIVNSYFFNFQIWYIIVAVIVNTVCVIAVDGIFALIIRRLLPQKWFSKDKKFFIVSKKECLFYEKLAIKKWKDKVIELGCFTNFRKNKIYEPQNNEYVARYILEANYGIIIHLVCIFVGFLIIFIYPLKYFLCFGIPVAIVNAFLNYLPYCILRYNLPKLNQLYRINEKRERKSKI